MAGGRPTKFDQSFCRLAENYARLGAVDSDLADFFGVSEATINNWKLEYPEFLESLKRGKANADGQVKKSLFQRAVGSRYSEEKAVVVNGDIQIVETTKQHPPDTTACIFWLKNRDPANWRDKVDLAHGADEKNPVQVLVTYKDAENKN